MDGYWSTWSSWSTCSSDCKHHRRRLCDSPAPENGGHYCTGSDLDTSNCTGGMCKGQLIRFIFDIGQSVVIWNCYVFVTFPFLTEDALVSVCVFSCLSSVSLDWPLALIWLRFVLYCHWCLLHYCNGGIKVLRFDKVVYLRSKSLWSVLILSTLLISWDFSE